MVERFSYPSNSSKASKQGESSDVAPTLDKT